MEGGQGLGERLGLGRWLVGGWGGLVELLVRLDVMFGCLLLLEE